MSRMAPLDMVEREERDVSQGHLAGARCVSLSHFWSPGRLKGTSLIFP